MPTRFGSSTTAGGRVIRLGAPAVALAVAAVVALLVLLAPGAGEHRPHRRTRRQAGCENGRVRFRALIRTGIFGHPGRVGRLRAGVYENKGSGIGPG